MTEAICLLLMLTALLSTYDPAGLPGRTLIVSLLLAELFAVSAMLYLVTHDPVVSTAPAAGLMLTYAWRILRRVM